MRCVCCGSEQPLGPDNAKLRHALHFIVAELEEAFDRKDDIDAGLFALNLARAVGVAHRIGSDALNAPRDA